MWDRKLGVHRDASLEVVVALCVGIRSLIIASKLLVLMMKTSVAEVEVVRVVQVSFLWLSVACVREDFDCLIRFHYRLVEFSLR